MFGVLALTCHGKWGGGGLFVEGTPEMAVFCVVFQHHKEMGNLKAHIKDGCYVSGAAMQRLTLGIGFLESTVSLQCKRG